jgi:SAM-dependent methyltransferase
MTTGGYDDGYRSCPCFWGTQPSSLVRRVTEWIPSLHGLRVLDVGCGEGKNAAFLAAHGARVDAFDVSPVAIAHARKVLAEVSNVRLEVADIQEAPLEFGAYDLVVAYGLLHCLPNETAVRFALGRLADATKPGGLHIVCVFNDRSQDLSAHPGFAPVLLPHHWYRERYASWRILEATDQDLTERHPHNLIEHTHSMTRLVARRPDDPR